MQTARPRVVVVGAGFAGIAAVKRLRGAPVDVTLIDRHNYHLFTPLLYEVASALLDPSEIAAPVRGMLHGARNVDFKLGTVDHIDLLQRRVVTDAGNLDYDYLIVAAGSVNNFFGIQSAETHTFALKELGAALALRNHVLSCFERASWSTDAEMRRHLQSFVVVGGGPTGIEFAGALHGLIHLVLRKDFRGLDMSEVSVQVLEATDRLLGAFAPDLAMAAARRLQDIGVEVLLKAQVESVDGSGVHLADGRELPAATVVWTAGVKASPLAAGLGAQLARGGRVKTLPTLQLEAHPEVLVVGDMAYIEHMGAPLPQLAPVALQQGKRAARNVEAMVRNTALSEFRYFDRGTMATIGRNAAVVQIGRLHFSGFAGWVIWLAVHLVNLVTFRSRVIVLINWAYDYLFYDRPVRLMLRAEREGG